MFEKCTDNISGMFYLRTSSLRHKIIQDNFGSSGSDWESSCFCITGFYICMAEHCFVAMSRR